MALTMTRTRTQTALTKLATMIANIHGELEFVSDLLKTEELEPGQPLAAKALQGLKFRHLTLLANRDALYTTIRQFDPKIDPRDIVAADGWRAQYGSRRLGVKSLLKRLAGQ